MIKIEINSELLRNQYFMQGRQEKLRCLGHKIKEGPFLYTYKVTYDVKFIVRSAISMCNMLANARGIWGHAPPEKFVK